MFVETQRLAIASQIIEINQMYVALPVQARTGISMTKDDRNQMQFLLVLLRNLRSWINSWRTACKDQTLFSSEMIDVVQLQLTIQNVL